MGEGKFLAGDGMKEVDHDFGGAREWRSERSDFPRCGEERRNSKRRSEREGFIYGQLFRVDCSI
jgi:hypothetical protein